MNRNYYAVIIAGGIGSRFWPVSTSQHPKQFQDLLNTGKTLVQHTQERLESVISQENVLIATNKKYRALISEQLPFIKKENIIYEPAMRNTAPCILLSALKIFKKNQDAVMIIAPSDHWIENVPEFLNSLENTFSYCIENDALLTLGIQPTYPNTGYGYIQHELTENSIKKVLNFTEKPNKTKAEEFLKEGNFLWNAGIFVWSAKSIIEAFKIHLPKMYTLFMKGYPLLNTEDESDFLAVNYELSQNISIDFGIMEKAENVFVLPVSFGWNDLGTWKSLHLQLPKDNEFNAKSNADVLFRNSKNNMVRVSENKKVVIQGLENFIVVEKGDVLLICPLDQEQEIKEIRENINSKFGSDFV